MSRRLLLALVVVSAVSVGAGAAHAASDVAISQVYGGGGNSGATLKNDFIELYNRSSSDISLTGWSVQYAATTGTSWQRTNLSGTIPAGGHYLVQEAAGAGGTTNLATPDAVGSIPMSASAGKVVLLQSQTTITSGTSCPTLLSSYRDLVGYGSGTNCFEGTGPTGTLSNMTAALRQDDGATDTDDNASDFAVGAPNPRNSGESAPAVASTEPAAGASGVALDASITIAFTEPVVVTDPWFAISCSTSGAHGATWSGGPSTFTVDPSADFVGSETCTVVIDGSHVSDVDMLDPPDTMSADYTFGFSTVAPPPSIHDIQGPGHASPLVNQNVSGVAGIVTHKLANGFFFQDPDPDDDPRTSEALFAFGSISAGQVQIGDSVTVSGRVSEFIPSGSANLPITEITNTSVQVQSHGTPLPAPVVWDPPTEVIEDDATGDVQTSGLFDPSNDGIDYAESLEDMRVEIDAATATGPSVSFTTSQTTEVSLVGAGAGVRTVRGGIVIRADDFNPERLILQATFGSLPDVNVGDTIQGATIGVLDYNFGNFKLRPGGTVTFVPGGIERETTSAAGPMELAIATFNVENLDPADGPAKFNRLAGLIVANLKAPDILALEEVQDNDGASNTSVTDANVTLDTLVAAIQAAGGPAYEWRQINPVDDQDGGEPGGNIRVAFLFRTDRGVEFVDRAGGGPTTPTEVVATPSGAQLTFSPGRIEPTSGAWNASRKPLAAEFKLRNRKFFLIANHFNSKGGDQPLFGRFQPPARSSEVQRTQQAQLVNEFVDEILAIEPKANIVTLGDFNDFEFSEVMNTLKGGVLSDMVETLPLDQRYSYVFEGNSQNLDHILVSNAVFGLPRVFDVVHVNAEFADQASDHDPSVLRLGLSSPPRGPTGGP